MYRVLIVDDEKWIREGLRTGFEWKDMGFEVCAVASNGVEALETVRALRPHVVITDIKMPLMDGLTFMKELSEAMPGTLSVVLSGYDHFEYAQQAIAYGAVAYLLKPVRVRELVPLMDKLKKRLDSERERESPAARGREAMLPEALREALTGGDCARLRSLLFPRGAAAACRLVIIECANDMAPESLAEALQNKGLELFCAYSGYVVGILRHVSGAEGRELNRRVIALLREAGVKDPVMASSDVLPDLAGVRAAYESTRGLLQYRFYSRPDTVITSRSIYDSGRLPDMARAAESIAAAIAGGSGAGLHILLHSLADSLHESYIKKGTLALKCMEFYFSVWDRLGFPPPAESEKEQVFEELMQANSISEFTARLRRLIRGLATRHESDSRFREMDVVERVEAFLRENFGDRLTLSMVAKNFHINSSYLSSLFCQRTGVSFSSYLQSLRMEHAKLLLVRSDNTIAEISKLVGYKEYRHFCAVFKKETGVTPMNYRFATIKRESL